MRHLWFNFDDLLIIIDGMCALLIVDRMCTLILLYLEFNQRFLTYLTLPMSFHLGFGCNLNSFILLAIPLELFLAAALRCKDTAIKLITLGPLADLKLNTLLLLACIPILLLLF